MSDIPSEQTHFNYQSNFEVRRPLSDTKVDLLSSSPLTPVRRTFDDTDVVIRDMREDEAEFVYTLFAQAARRGMGYNLGEIGDFQYFRESHLRGKLVIVAECSDRKEILCVNILQSTRFQRHQRREGLTMFATTNPNVHSCTRLTVMLAMQYVLKLADRIGVRHGYSFILSSTSLMNSRALTGLNTRYQVIVVGTLPDGIYLQGQGWDDLVYVYRTPHLASAL